jgi:hypothetical protein
MSFAETNLFGVYVAPISLMMIGAWFVTIALRLVASRYGLLRYVWHPALFVFAIYIIVLSSWILLVARRSSWPLLKSQRSAAIRPMIPMPSGHLSLALASPRGAACE